MAKFLRRPISVLLAVLMIVSVFAVCPISAGAIADTSDPWIIAVDGTTEYDLDGKWVRYDNEDFQLIGNKTLSFQLKPGTTTINLLKFGDEIIAQARPTTSTGTRALGTTAYVTGLGTEDYPYIFSPNMIYGKSGATNFTASGVPTVYAGYENLPSGTSADNLAVPGDAFKEVCRISVGSANRVKYEKQGDTLYEPNTSGYIGVRSGKYGRYASNFTTGASFAFEPGNDTLYYLGRQNYDTDKSVYTFSESINIRSDLSGQNKVICTVNWANQDGTNLKTLTYDLGETPADQGLAPTKDEDAAYTYTFTGFEPAYEPLTDDMTYVATYNATPKGEQTYTVKSWIFSTNDGRVYDEADDLEHKCYKYNDTIGKFPEGGGAFSVENGQLKLCDLVVADIDTAHPAYKNFANTVYVTGTGTQDDPFIFNPNYIYGTSGKSQVKEGVSVAIDAAHRTSSDNDTANPGDGFKAMSRIRTSTQTENTNKVFNVQFLQQLGYYRATRYMLGVSDTNYGYRYQKTKALPFNFVSNDHILYYFEKSDSGIYQFSETEPPYRTNFSATDSTVHTVTWKNFDGTVLDKETYYVNDTPSYKGDTPVKPSDDDYNYTFSGWTPAVSPVTADVEYTATYTQSDRLFVGYSLTLKGDIGLNFYLNVIPEQITTGEGVNVHFEWDVKGNTKTSDYKLKTNEYKVIGGKTYYKATCWVAAAEMNYDIHATATINGALHPDTDDYSVKKYGMDVIGAPAGEFEKQDKLVALVKEMLNYGAQAQKVFDRLDVPLANADVTGYAMTEIGYETIPEQKSKMKEGLSELGLEYQGTTVVFLTKTTLRHYYSITDQSKFDSVKDSATFTYKDDKLSTGGVIYFEKSDISASDLDLVQTFSIGGKTYNYSVLDYSRSVLKSGAMTDNEKKLAMSTYWYNRAADAYFDAP